MSFYSNWKIREWGRQAVLPVNEIKDIIINSVFKKYLIENVVDFGAGTLYWSKWFKENAEHIYPVDIIYESKTPDTDFDCIPTIDRVPWGRADQTLFFMCDVLHHIPKDVWMHVRRRAV